MRRLPLPPATAAPLAARMTGRRIGLLGGSFNPAHDGHRHISLAALKTLGLDEVWWLVSPQNPLKSTDGMASFAKRFTHAAIVARHPRIRVLDIEARLGTTRTVETLQAMRQLFPQTRFVWLMGADNLATIHQWHQWQDIFRLVPIAVFDRAQYSVSGPMGKAAQRFRRYRVADRHIGELADQKPPAWAFLRIPRHPQSATEIRAQNPAWLDETGRDEMGRDET